MDRDDIFFIKSDQKDNELLEGEDYQQDPEELIDDIVEEDYPENSGKSEEI